MIGEAVKLYFRRKNRQQKLEKKQDRLILMVLELYTEIDLHRNIIQSENCHRAVRLIKQL